MRVPVPLPLGARSSRSLWPCPPQVSIRLDGENKAVEYNAVGAVKDAVRVVFRGARVSDLFDRDWHKIALSVQAQNVSLYIDCALVQTLPIEERENIDIQGKTVIGKRLYDSVPIDVSARVLGPAGRRLGGGSVSCCYTQTAPPPRKGQTETGVCCLQWLSVWAGLRPAVLAWIS